MPTLRKNNKSANWPKVSIITPSFNQGQFLEDTILSILDQDYPNLEFFIIDGGSTDNTLDIIRKYESRIDWWVSEPDQGQTHAIKKGLSKVTGDIFNWINSDDMLAPNALWNIAKVHQEMPDNIIAGPVLNFTEKETALIQNRNLTFDNFLLNSEDLSYHQPGVWFPLQRINITDALDTNYHYCFDHKMMIEVLSREPSVSYIPQTVAHFRLHDQSKSVASSIRFHHEFFRLFDEYLQDKRFFNYRDKIQAAIQRHHQKWDWRDHLLTIRSQKTAGWVKAMEIGRLMLLSPDKYLNRFTLGALKKSLLEHT